MQTGSHDEDVWQTKNPIHWQFAYINGFIFTNSYFAMNCFKKLSTKHVDFKKNLDIQMFAYNPDGQIRSLQNTEKVSMQGQVASTHVLQKTVAKGEWKQKPCNFCQHGGKEPKRTFKIYFCSECRIDKPICPPTSSKYCFKLHIIHGMPSIGIDS